MAGKETLLYLRKHKKKVTRLKKLWKEYFLFQPAPDPAWPIKRRTIYYIYRVLILLCAGICMGLALLSLAIGPYTKEVIFSYFRYGTLLVLNTLPVVLLIFLFYGLTGNAWSAFLLGGGIFFGFSMGNYYKLQFRDDPLYFEDMLILHEAKAMATGGHYTLFLDIRIIFALFCLILGTVLLAILTPGKNRNWRPRTIAAVTSLVIAGVMVPVYLDDDRYEAIENYEELERWSATQNYISRGFIYPFFHSINNFLEIPPAGYSKDKAEALLSAYSDADIPAEKQINIIGLMREAYVDFSRYNVEGLDVSEYAVYHALEAESYTGDLVTNIFAGGTVDTERCFLTGDYSLRNFRGSTNSYVWYLRDQGYSTEGSHPYHQWFYNRMNINSYLGFEKYRFLENDYERFTNAIYPEDAILFPEIYKDFQAAQKPCFSFSVNVQSHGPYATWDTGAKQYLTGNYSDKCKYAVNAYMSAIMETDRELSKFVDLLRDDPEPVVLITFGDHLPWMGDGNAYYNEMGININPGTEDGFFRHYSTRYLIWANDAAKKIIGHDLQGEGPAVSPCYLMNVLFDQLGWKGPAFMQAMHDMMEVFPVKTTTGWTVTDGVLDASVPENRKDLLQDFYYLQHYWRNEFLYNHTLEK